MTAHLKQSCEVHRLTSWVWNVPRQSEFLLQKFADSQSVLWTFSSWQCWGRCQLKKEFRFLVGISHMNGWVCSRFLMMPPFKFSIMYVSHVGFQMEADYLPLGFSFTDSANFGDFTLLFVRGQLRNVQSFKRHVPNCYSAHYSFCFAMSLLSSPLSFALKSLKCLHCKTNLIVTYLPSNLKILVFHKQVDFLCSFLLGAKLNLVKMILNNVSIWKLKVTISKFLLVPYKIPWWRCSEHWDGFINQSWLTMCTFFLLQ